jgi:hypothetical protein
MTTDAVTPLRHRTIEDMNARKLSAGTQRGHIHGCKRERLSSSNPLLNPASRRKRGQGPPS